MINIREDYLLKIKNIPDVSFNKEQKEIAKKIISSADEKDLDSIYNLITQRVKTGFVFDEAPEINHNCVALIKENKKLNIVGDGFEPVEHKLIIGENYDTLKNLCATYIDKNGKGLIDVIYIDPPYNTEASKKEGNDYKEEIETSKFIYRDKFTRDGWLNMMNERLKLAKRLLSDKGVIFISIDDSEQAYLKVLCDEIFGESNFVGQLIHQRAKGGGQAKYIVKGHDYILVYGKNISKVSLARKKIVQQRTYEINGELYIKNDDVVRKVFGKYDKSLGDRRCFYEQLIEFKGEEKKKEIDEQISKGELFLEKNKDGMHTICRYEKVSDTTSKLYSIIKVLSEEGKEDIEYLGINAFSYPKPVKLIRQLIEAGAKDDSIILDFFAGSGTTGQAVMELNEDDGGKRQFILVTNNENNIGTEITRERLYRVIKGKGSNGESIKWQTPKGKPCLSSNCVSVFDITNTELTLNDLEKAEKIRDIAKVEFKKLNPNCSFINDFDIYNELSALNPYKKKEE